MTFMILLKLYVWEKSNSQVNCESPLSQPGSGIFKLYYLKNYQRYKVDFLHAGAYLLKLQIDVIVGGCGQACPQACQKRPLKLLDLKNKRFEVDLGL